jgi:hypothetical protein
MQDRMLQPLFVGSQTSDLRSRDVPACPAQVASMGCPVARMETYDDTTLSDCLSLCLSVRPHGQVHVTYMEIYNDAGYDLLDPQREVAMLEDLQVRH